MIVTLRQIRATRISAELHTFFQLTVPLLERLINMQCFAGRTVPRIQLKGSTHKGHCCCACGERFDCLMHKLSTYLLGLSEAIAYSSGVSRRWETKVTGVQAFGLRFLFPIVACCTVKRCCEFLKLIAIHHALDLINVAREVLGCQGFWRFFSSWYTSCGPWALAAVSGIPTLVGNVAVHWFLILKWPGCSAILVWRV